MIGSLIFFESLRVCTSFRYRRGRRRVAVRVACDSSQQVPQCLKRVQIDLGTLQSRHRRAGRLIEHPQRHTERNTRRAAAWAAAGCSNAHDGNHLVDEDVLPTPRVKVVENPPRNGTVGVRKSSCASAAGPRWWPTEAAAGAPTASVPKAISSVRVAGKIGTSSVPRSARTPSTQRPSTSSRPRRTRRTALAI